SVDTMIPGTPPLGILSNGLLTVTPASPGLYVFAVLVEEFREGKKIGQVQRDFQMLVIDGCSPPAPPRVAVKIPGNDFFQPETDTLVYAFNDAKCFDFVVTNISEGETIRLQARGVNFEGRLDSIFSFTQQKVGPNMDSLLVTVCAPDCPPLGERPFVVDLIAGDDACPLPQLDTLRLVMQVQPLPNVFPVFTPGGNQTVTLNENNQFDQLIDATDADGDLIGFSLYIPGVDDPTRYGFDLTITDTRPGMAQALFHWDTNCEKFDFSTRQSFTVFVAVDDQDDCDRPNPDKAIFFCEVILPPNTSPVVDLPGTTDTSRTVLANTSLVIDVSATDADGDTIQLWMVGEGFNPAAYGAVMAPASGTGTAQSVFKWDPDCHLMDAGKPNAFTFLFIAGDLDRCREPNFDTLRYTITVQLPPNDPPALIPVAADFTLEVNVPFRLDIAATDHLDDVMVLSFHDAFRLPPTHTLEFPSVTGAGEVRSTLEWTPECSLLEDGGPTTYTLGFRVTDSACPLAGYDTMAVRFTLMETRRQFDDFLPPNVFTPNGDNLNDVFTMSGQEDPSGNLPADNCDDAFEYITIHDRSGRTVFFSQDRGFVWTGHSNSPGVYFYVVKYTRTMYKGHLQLLR
ncbi:MAG: gliding motility-associated C-terminal domain-containing protein, partial [Cyclobacteriaceae bacterium]|nr:gliding motility-associated C-terminal domain-containing protein [Cyclobacteriaceae bacterium]